MKTIGVRRKPHRVKENKSDAWLIKGPHNARKIIIKRQNDISNAETNNSNNNNKAINIIEMDDVAWDRVLSEYGVGNSNNNHWITKYAWSTRETVQHVLKKITDYKALQQIIAELTGWRNVQIVVVRQQCWKIVIIIEKRKSGTKEEKTTRTRDEHETILCRRLTLNCWYI